MCVLYCLSSCFRVHQENRGPQDKQEIKDHQVLLVFLVLTDLGVILVQMYAAFKNKLLINLYLLSSDDVFMCLLFRVLQGPMVHQEKTESSAKG